MRGRKPPHFFLIVLFQSCASVERTAPQGLAHMWLPQGGFFVFCEEREARTSGGGSGTMKEPQNAGHASKTEDARRPPKGGPKTRGGARPKGQRTTTKPYRAENGAKMARDQM